MDISTINDISNLKALAYDEIRRKEMAERNLTLINERITVLENYSQKQGAVESINSNSNNESKNQES